MSITSPDTRITTYSPVVPTTEFSALFPVFSNGDLAVLHNGVRRSDFTVSATYVEGISTNAKVVFSIGVVGDVKVFGSRAPRRASRFSNGGPLPIWSQNLALDTLESEVQEARRDIDRSVKVGIGQPAQEFPKSENGSLIGWDNAGHLENKSISILTDIVAEAEAARDDIAGIVASIAVITEHPPFTVFLGQDSVAIPGGYDVVAYVFLNSLRFYAWSAPDGLTITFPPLTIADTDGAASVEMVIGTGFNSVFAFDTVDGGAF